jgi:diguanylate cyclase (GGDEF)-like protein/PAS domain S-box-containing protein
MITVSLAVAGVGIYVLYQTSFKQQQKRLEEIAKSQVSLIEAIADTNDDPESVLSALTKAHKNLQKFSETGEFTLGKRQGDYIVFLFDRQHYQLAKPKPVPWQGKIAEPMRLALQGKSGSTIALDYRGVLVLAAYEPMPNFNWGIVAKIDMAEIRAPFIEAGIYTIMASLVVDILGAILFFKISNPLLRRLEESETKNRAILEAAAEGIIALNDRYIIESFNAAAEQIFGLGADTVIGKNIELLIPRFELLPALKELLQNNHEMRSTCSHTGDEGLRADGTTFPIELAISTMQQSDRQIFALIVRDITERKLVEAQLDRLNRSLKAIGECNRALVTATEESQLLANICQIVVEVGGYQSAWVAFVKDETFQEIIPGARAESNDFELTNIVGAAEVREVPLIETAIRTGQLAIACHLLPDETRAKLSSSNNSTCIALPLIINDRPLGALSICSVELDISLEEVRLLTDLAGDLAYGIETLRNRIAREEAETALRQLNHDLENIVRQRTNELTNLNQELIHEIGERQQVEMALRKSEVRYRTVVEAQTELVCRFLPDTTIAFVNEAYCRCFQKKPNKLVGHKFFEFLPKEEREAVMLHLETLNSAREVASFEHCASLPDGQLQWQQWFYRAICDDRGKITEYQAVGRDISDRKQAENILRESEERFRAVFEQAAVGMVISTLEGRFFRINQKFCDILGYTRSELLGLSFQEVTPPEYLALNLERVGQLLAGEIHSYSLERPYICKDRTLVWVYLVVSLIREGTGEPKYFIGVVEDISDRKLAEANLQKSEERFRTTFELAAVGIAEATEYGKFLRVNQKFCDIVGYSEKELKNLTTADITHPQDVEKDRKLKERLSAREIETFSIEKRYIRKDGSLVWVHCTESLVCQKLGEQDYFISAIQDISDRKQAQQELRIVNYQLALQVQELERRNQEMNQLGDMSEFLQACISLEEAYKAISDLLQPLFPGCSGAVFAMSDSRHLVEAVASWGNSPQSEILFAPDCCWGLRRGLIHRVEAAQLGLFCQHISHKHKPAVSVCLPMIGQGETLGLLYLSSSAPEKLTETKQQLAHTVAEHIALAIANLKLRESLHERSIRDPLTCLFNRRYLKESLERELRRALRNKHSVGIMMIDVDRFKNFNDTYGHEAGDAVLRELGVFLRNNTRGGDIACRYGGEELTLILPEANLKETQQRAEEIRQGIKYLKIDQDNQSLGVITVSIGVACFPENGSTGADALQAADRALYRAKELGRDRVVCAVAKS